MRYIGCHLSSSAGFAAMGPAIHGAAGPSPWIRRT